MKKSRWRETEMRRRRKERQMNCLDKSEAIFCSVEIMEWMRALFSHHQIVNMMWVVCLSFILSSLLFFFVFVLLSESSFIFSFWFWFSQLTPSSSSSLFYLPSSNQIKRSQTIIPMKHDISKDIGSSINCVTNHSHVKCQVNREA